MNVNQNKIRIEIKVFKSLFCFIQKKVYALKVRQETVLIFGILLIKNFCTLVRTQSFEDKVEKSENQLTFG